MLPRVLCKKWNGHLTRQKDEVVAKPFPLLSHWVIAQRNQRLLTIRKKNRSIPKQTKVKQFRCALHEGEPGNLVNFLICNLCLGVIQIVCSSGEG